MILILHSKKNLTNIFLLMKRRTRKKPPLTLTATFPERGPWTESSAETSASEKQKLRCEPHIGLLSPENKYASSAPQRSLPTSTLETSRSASGRPPLKSEAFHV